jgi:amino acid transporter
MPAPLESSREAAPQPATSQPLLGWWDAASIIVGIVVGTAIFRSPTLVFQNVAAPWQALAIWLVGGVLSLCGALCYAELATLYPRNGGDYEYLTRAYGRTCGFLFGWAQLAVVRSASIGTMGFTLADYVAQVWPVPEAGKAWIASAVILALTVVNLFGLRTGKITQNLFTCAKVVGLSALAGAGLLIGQREALLTQAVELRDAALVTPANWSGWGMAMVFVLYAFGGWNDAVFVAAEVREPKKNLPRALFVGLLAITVIYLAVNTAMLAVLGLGAARQTMTPAADVMQHAVGPGGAAVVSTLVVISAIGAINGMILTGPRIYATMGRDHRLFRWLARGCGPYATPMAAIVAQGAAAILLVFAVGISQGRRAIDSGMQALHLPALPWKEYFGGFDTLLAATAPVFWAFFLLTGIAVVILRYRDPRAPRPFLVPLFPLPVVIFCASCGFMIYSAIAYAGWLTLIGLVPLLSGGVLLGFTSLVRLNYRPRDAKP